MKNAWVATAGTFRRLLEWLDEGVDSNGAKYLEMRRRLAWYFQRKRCLSPDELADETLNRVARRLDEEGAIANAVPAQYCYIVARFVFLEHIRATGAEGIAARELGADRGPAIDRSSQERLLDCLDRCLQQLSEGDRELILDYYRAGARGKIESRRTLAARLVLTANALTVRACRIRDKLEACLSRCSADV